MTLDLAHITLAIFSITLYLTYMWERRRAHKREEAYMRALLARDLRDYDDSTENRIAEMKKESELAEKAYKLQHLDHQPEQETHYPMS